jgi:hypothetical protein
MSQAITMRLQKPYCVVQAEERAKDFPKQERLNSMRRYIAEYDLFPAKSDPRNAPITMNELKALVRKWKLHHRRNFWANHRTRDEVVFALYEHRQHQLDLVATRRKLKKDREARGSSMSKLDRSKITREIAEATAMSPKRELSRDIFGTEALDFFMEKEEDLLTKSKGVLFKKENFGYPEGFGRGFDEDFGIDLEEAALAEVLAEAENAVADNPLSPGGSNVVANPDEDEMLEVKRKVSLALLNFTLNTQIRGQFLEDGGLESLVKLSQSTHDTYCVERCLACFINLVADPEYKPMVLMTAGILQVIFGILKLELSDIVDSCCLTVVVALSIKPECESYLLAEGAVKECLRCLGGPHRDNKIFAAKALVNLMENMEGPQAETLTKSLMQCIRQLSHETGGDGVVVRFCAECLMTLTCMAAARPILANLGAINIIKQLAGSKINEVTQQATASLANLALLKSTHKEMVQLGVVIVLRELMNKGDEYIKQQCTLCMANLSASADLRPLMESQGALASLNNIVSTCEVDLTLVQTAKTLLNFACDDTTRSTLLKTTAAGNSVDALVKLFDPSRPDAMVDALCAVSWLSKDRHTVDGVFLAGVVEALKPLMTVDDARPMIVLILFNLTSLPDKLRVLLDLGALGMLLNLAQGSDEEVREKALHSIEAFSRDPAMQEPLFDHAIVRALGKVVEAGQERPAVHLASLILHRLTTLESNLTKVVDNLGVRLLIQLAEFGKEEDAAARATYAVIAASYYNICQRKAVMEDGFLDSVITLAKCKENKRVLWISTVLFFTSTYPRGRKLLSKNRWLIPSLLNMMRSGCDDLVQIQYNCASALCNAVSAVLSKNDILAMVDEGVIQDLGIISVLRTNSIATKQVMSKALFNLLAREETREDLVKAQLAQAMVRLTKEDNKELSILCVQMTLNLSSEIDRYAKYLVEMQIHRVLVGLSRSTAGGAEFKRLAGNALANMSVHDDFAKPMAELTQDDERERDRAAKIIPGLLAISGVNEEQSTQDCAFVLQNLTRHEHCRRNLAQDDVIELTVKLAKTGNLTTAQMCAATLCYMSTVKGAYADIVQFAIPTLVLTMKNPSLQLVPRMDAARAVANLVVFYPPSREVCLAGGITTAVNVLLKSTREESDMVCLAKILRDLSRANEAPFKMLQEHAILSLVKLAHLEDAQLKHDVSTTICNLATCKFATDIVQDGVIEAFFWLILQDALAKTKPIFLEVSIALRYIAQNPRLIKYVATDEGRLISVLTKLAKFDESVEVQYNAAVIFYYCIKFKPAQDHLIRQGALEIIIRLAQAEGEGIQDVCSATLHELPNDKLKDMDATVLKVLMALLTIEDADFANADRFLPNRDHAATGAWSQEEGDGQHSEESDPHEASWPPMVIDKTMRAFKADTMDGEKLVAEEWKKGVSGEAKMSQIGGVKKLVIEVNEVDSFKIDEMHEKKAADKKAGGAMHGKSMDDDTADSSSQSHSQATDMLDYREEERIDRENGVDPNSSGGLFLDTLDMGEEDVASDFLESPKLPSLGAPTPVVPPPQTRSNPASPSSNNRRDDRLEDIHLLKRGKPSPATAKMETFQNRSLASAFESGTKSVPILTSANARGGQLEGDDAAEKKQAAAGAADTPGKKKKKKKKDPEAFMAARRSRQQDRVADDYATMLYAARGP